MHGIGNEHDAQTIYFWVASQRQKYDKPRCAYQAEAPLGWEYIGSGSFRSVWRSPEGVAYKVEHNNGDFCQSAEEIENLKLAWRKGAPEGCRLPKFDEFRVDGEVVVAIELIEGNTLYDYEGPEKDDLYERLSQCEMRFHLGDLHDENVVVDHDGFLVPVDLGN